MRNIPKAVIAGDDDAAAAAATIHHNELHKKCKQFLRAFRFVCAFFSLPLAYFRLALFVVIIFNKTCHLLAHYRINYFILNEIYTKLFFNSVTLFHVNATHSACVCVHCALSYMQAGGGDGGQRIDRQAVFRSILKV